MIDVHVLIHPTTPPGWVSQCIVSVQDAIACAGMPVTLHTLAATEGRIGEGRASGYAVGHYHYVTCVDDDDYILPSAFANMRVALESGADAVATPEWLLQNGCLSPGPNRHHLIAYRRELIIDHRPWVCCGDVAQKHAPTVKNWIDIIERGYVHRVYESRARIMRRCNLEELELARG